MRRVLLAVTVLVLAATTPMRAATRTVGSGKTYATIQACADAAQPGDTCVVDAGTYNERVTTVRDGTGESTRITFLADGTVTMKGFVISHAYTTVQGFTITGHTTAQDGLVEVLGGGDYCTLTSNTIQDGAASVRGIYFRQTSGAGASYCTVQSNTISDLQYTFVLIDGDHHTFTSNTFQYQNGFDFLYLFGHDMTFRRNIFRYTGTNETENHPDTMQTFGDATSECQDYLFEENWIEDIETQMGNLASASGAVDNYGLWDNVKNITFRRNVIIGTTDNFNAEMPGLRFEHNTFYRHAYQSNGIAFASRLTRGTGSNAYLAHNVFLGGGSTPTVTDDNKGWYIIGNSELTTEVLAYHVTSETSPRPNADALYADLIERGWITAADVPTAAARALTNISQFSLDAEFDAYKQATYDHLLETIALDVDFVDGFYADYNYVAGSAAASYPAKNAASCGGAIAHPLFNFCETHGINGGNPSLTNINDPDGADNVPFTVDDGLKPSALGTLLCGKGINGVDIGAYSCDPAVVFAGLAVPTAPTNVRIR